MDASDFNKHFQSIREEKFDNTRMAKAKDLVSDNPLTSSQIKELSNLFTFEASKLEFAKFAYTNCDDPENYPSVAEGFKYESSKKELEEYIAQNRVD